MTSLKLEEFLNLQKDWKFVSVLSFNSLQFLHVLFRSTRKTG